MVQILLFILQRAAKFINASGVEHATSGGLFVGDDSLLLYMLSTTRVTGHAVCPGGATGIGCGGVLQLPAFRLSHYLHHHTVSYCEC